MQSVEQLAFADVVVINKTDLVTDEEKTALKQRIKVLHKNIISLYYDAMIPMTSFHECQCHLLVTVASNTNLVKAWYQRQHPISKRFAFLCHLHAI